MDRPGESCAAHVAPAKYPPIGALESLLAEENELNIRPDRWVFRLWKAAARSPWLRPFCAGIAVGFFVLLAAGSIWLPWGVSSSANRQAIAPSAAPSLPAAAPAAEAAAASYTIVLWRDGSGVLRRAGIDTARYDAFVAAARRQMDEDQRSLAAARGDRLRAELAPLFEQIDNQVSGYADWVFDWWTSWILLGRTFEWTGRGLTTGSPLTLPDRVQAKLVGTVQHQFITRVLEPRALKPQVDAALHGAVVAMRQDLLADCAKYQQSFADFIRSAARQVERQDPAQGWITDPSWDRSAATFQSICDRLGKIDEAALRDQFPVLLELKANDSPVNDVILRLARPFATKLISFVVLPVIVAAILGGILLPLFGQLPSVLANVITGMLTGAVGALLIGLAASASVDWLLNRTDAALNRPGFEADVRKAIISMESDFVTRVLEVEERSIDRQMQALATAMAGEDAPP
jgi:hypothetical protein